MRSIFLFLCGLQLLWAQAPGVTPQWEVSLFRGNVLPHTSDLYHLQGHPEGVILAYNWQTHGSKEWHRTYDNPNYGMYLLYQDFNNRFLGHSWAVGGQFQFFFLNRHLRLTTAAGVAYMNQPYDKVTNSKNKAFGSPLLANINLGLHYQIPLFRSPWTMQAGFLFTHYSNGRTKSPNSGINSYGLNLGLTYSSPKSAEKTIDTSVKDTLNYRQKLHYNVVVRTGVNESSVINSGQYPFLHLGAYVDKRLNRKSGLQLGVDVFLTQSLKDFIRYKSAAFPEDQIDPNTDYRRVGLFAGYEWYINRLSFEAQVGYYVYDRLQNDIPLYDRIGLKYYWTPKVYSSLSLKTHLFLAEAIEWGIGIRL